MSAINLIYSETVKKRETISCLDPENTQKLALKVDEYIKSKDFPHPQDDGTQEQWDQLSKDLWERHEESIIWANIVDENMKKKTPEPSEPLFVVKCIAKGAYAIGYGISMFGRFYNEEANDTWFNKEVEFIYT